MPKLKVSLGIGFNGAVHRDVFEIDQEDWDDCKTEQDRETLINNIAMEWAWNYIDIGTTVVEDEE
jgi:hypothetical protein